ncbi:MAG: tail fiber protein [Pseudomonadota bacterium]
MLKYLKRLTCALSGALLLSVSAQAAPDTFIGDLQLTPYNFCPEGTLEAAGQLLNTSTNPALFALLGSNYGGNGRTTFALPDLRGRIAIGVAQGAGNYGARSGQERVTLTVPNLPPHNHRINTGTPNAVVSPNAAGVSELPAGVNAFSQSTTPNGSTMNRAVIGHTGNNIPFPVIAPTLAMKWCITVRGQFPPRS